MFQISDTPLDIMVTRQLADARAGGFVSFEGWVRNENENKEVKSLEYEAYNALAIKEGERIIQKAKDEFDIIDVLCIHRVGHLQIGDLAVIVAATAKHRGPAFEACQAIIDTVKVRVPIWKKEHYVDGDSGWVNCEECAHHEHDHHLLT